ncbi:MAG TPA: chalcone isomerase family protein [Nitrospiraceae bacterium]|nr:chalcone isomerase family protein [Nitrospiraceae bacterium]
MVTLRPHSSLFTWLAGCVVAGMVVFTPLAQAAEIEGIAFSDSYRAGSITMPLRGVGLAKFLRTIKVYVGALYLQPGVEPDMVLSDVPKRLELSYFRALKAGDFGQAADKVLADNVPPATIATLKPRIERMHRLYEDVKPGDRYGLTYLPGVGTELALNGQRKGIIEGADFAAAYFAIWLGPDPINEALKEGLLNRR